MRAYEFIPESKQPDMPETYVLTNILNNDPYKILRLGVAISAARGGTDVEPSSAVGEHLGVVSYGENPDKLIDKALRQIGEKGKVKKGGSRREKSEDVNSLLPQFKGFKK